MMDHLLAERAVGTLKTNGMQSLDWLRAGQWTLHSELRETTARLQPSDILPGEHDFSSSLFPVSSCLLLKHRLTSPVSQSMFQKPYTSLDDS